MSFNSQSGEAITPDMIVLDIMLPDGNGVEFLRELRAAGRDIPVLFLTAMGTAEDMVAGLDAGGDDYLTKPYDYKVFMARIKTILRREQAANKRIKEAAEGKPDILTYGLLTINTVTRLAYRGKETLQLQTKQFGLLLLLAQRKNETLSASYLYEAIWGQPMGNDVQALRKAISRIRSEIKGCGYSITSERDKGYRFEKGE